MPSGHKFDLAHFNLARAHIKERFASTQAYGSVARCCRPETAEIALQLRAQTEGLFDRVATIELGGKLIHGE